MRSVKYGIKTEWRSGTQPEEQHQLKMGGRKVGQFQRRRQTEKDLGDPEKNGKREVVRKRLGM